MNGPGRYGFDYTYPSVTQLDYFQSKGLTLAVAAPLKIRVSGDAWQGNPQFAVAVDGVRVAPVHAVTADHAAGEWNEVLIDLGRAALDASEIEIVFVNDAGAAPARTAPLHRLDRDRRQATRRRGRGAEHGDEILDRSARRDDADQGKRRLRPGPDA